MPFTSFHLGPGLLLGLVFFGYLDFPTFLIANVIVDVEPFLVLALNLNYPIHGFLHSFLCSTLLALLLAVTFQKVRARLTPFTEIFELEQKISLRSVLLASFSGAHLHVLLDSPLYSDIKPFYPLDVNPFLSNNPYISFGMYAVCVLSFIGGIAIYIVKLTHQREK